MRTFHWCEANAFNLIIFAGGKTKISVSRTNRFIRCLSVILGGTEEYVKLTKTQGPTKNQAIFYNKYTA